MRFLILTQYFPPEIGAPATRLMAVARELIAAGHKLEIVTCMPNYPSGRIFPEYRGCFYRFQDEDGIGIHRVWVYPSIGKGVTRILNYASFALTSLYGLARSHRPDYIIVESPPLSTTLAGHLAAIIWGCPFIMNVADLWPDSVEALHLMSGMTGRGFIRIARGLEAYVYRKALFVTAVTEGILQALADEKKVPHHKLLYLPNGVDTELFSVQPPDEELKRSLGLQGKRLITYAGTIGYAHGIGVAIEAASLISSRKDLHFLFIGDGSERARFVNEVTMRRLRNVTFLAPVPVSELPKYFSISLCGLVTLRDGIPLLASARPAKTLPILACGKPVVFCGGVHFPRIIRQEKLGLTVTHNDPTGLAEALCSLADNSTLTAELGENARRYALSTCKWSSLVTTWLSRLPDNTRQDASIHGCVSSAKV